MPSEIAKKVAGTFISDNAALNANVAAWLTGQCRTGQLKESVENFCREQAEIIDPALVVVEVVSNENLHCKVPVRVSDHESAHTFLTEIKFHLNPFTGRCVRQAPV